MHKLEKSTKINIMLVVIHFIGFILYMHSWSKIRRTVEIYSVIRQTAY